MFDKLTLYSYSPSRILNKMYNFSKEIIVYANDE